MADPVFLPGVPAEHVLGRLAQADGDEIESGKIFSPDSSAFLAVNTFGWFIPHPALIPAFPGLEHAYPATMVDVEFSARFPWRGGRHPSLDAVIETPTFLIGVESKRFEPFRDTKSVDFSDAYSRPVWGDNMGPYERLRDQLRGGTTRFRYLDAAQLVKHAFGLVTEGRRSSKAPVLVYLFAEPAQLGGKDIEPEAIARHRAEVMEFEQTVAGSEVAFHHTSYRDWIETWSASADTVIAHGQRLLDAFKP